MDKYSYLSNATPEYIENLYLDFKANPASVDVEFKKFFEGFDYASSSANGNGKATSVSLDEIKVYKLITDYRDKAHLISTTNPLQPRKDRKANLELENFGLSEKDLERRFQIGNEIGLPNATLSEIIAKLKAVYAGNIGFEFGYVRTKEERDWLLERIEKPAQLYNYNIGKKEQIFRALNRASVFEKFLGTKYIGEKRFSLEGGETTIPALEAIINKSAELGAEEVIFGMAHRGRLNVLANIIGKTYEEIFNEFEGNIVGDPIFGDGDVKYHLGYTSLFKAAKGKSVYLKLMPNPSHLEAVSPVIAGFCRAKANTIYNEHFEKILPIAIHGDAALAGQGIIYEVLQMEKLPGYHIGGTLHFVINNQIGFTTGFEEARSSDYSTSIAATIEAPVFHVNGDDAEATVFVSELAAEYRQTFKKDVFVDMVCYRKWGHNESDDPKFTQPLMYQLIDKHVNPRDVYSKVLEQQGEMGADLAKKLEKEFWAELQERLDLVKQKPLPYKPQPTEEAWNSLRSATGKDFEQSPETGVKEATLLALAATMNTIPQDFSPLKKMKKYLAERQTLMVEEKRLDWAAGELLAYASILNDGKDVRFSGEDVERGTFTHRHAVIYDENNGNGYNRLSKLSPTQGKFRIYNSHLSEYGVLGFEYGYSMVHPEPLVIWEAQFGDFNNGAQIMIDQFIAAAESKWQRCSGLVMLLPHGYEGQGPEHSSARLERFLQLCAELNMVVTNISSPANYFHAMRRQLAWEFRKPLIVMSPKSLLRHPQCVSDLSEITTGTFREIIADEPQSKNIRRILFCSGKIYFDLKNKQTQKAANDVLIVRIEQLYPIPEKQMQEVVKKYPKAEVVWVQEEPLNMGAWSFLIGRLYDVLPMKVVARKNSASPATGYKKQHLKEQEAILEAAFA
ncbi:MAG: 2-oxoglutarate dehydrogenase E1 component [Chitinophagales bacterium]|nr:2-oxoglutarate dehydrogenase E1 component [Chitinophagales bacterium]HRP39507.1 2-oxoglutarate dehydrogenase E1 component [Chitinophagales bacterium]